MHTAALNILIPFVAALDMSDRTSHLLADLDKAYTVGTIEIIQTLDGS